MELVDLARQISRADQMVGMRANARLKVIVEQIRALQAQARRVLEETRHDQDLHRVPCSFKRIPGQTYHLYDKGDGVRYFSLLSPADWCDQPPHEHLGAYRLENDLSWTLADIPETTDEIQGVVQHLLDEGLLPSPSRD
jgi:hypothetical protein